MIDLTFTHPDTNLETIWSVNFRRHSPFEEVRTTQTSDAGDYVDPEVHFGGSYDKTQLTSNPIAASEIATFYLFRRATERGTPFTVGANVVPLVASDYRAIRLGNLKPIELDNGRRFRFVLNTRVTELI